MNKTNLPHPSAIIKYGFETGNTQLALLLKLSALYGLMAAIILAPTNDFLVEFIEVASSDTTTNDAIIKTVTFTDMLLIITGQITALLLQALLLVLWSRAVSSQGLPVYEGGSSLLLARTKDGFKCLLIASLLSLAALLAGVIAIYLVSMFLGSIGLVIAFACVILMVWAVIFIGAVGQFALFHAAHDANLTITEAWNFLKPNAFPFSVAAATYIFIALFANIILNIALGENIAATVPRIMLAINNSLGFAASAYFIAAISRLNLR